MLSLFFGEFYALTTLRRLLCVVRVLPWHSSSISAARCCLPLSHRRRVLRRLPPGTILPGSPFLWAASFALWLLAWRFKKVEGGRGRRQKAESSPPSAVSLRRTGKQQLGWSVVRGPVSRVVSFWPGCWLSKAALNYGIGCMSERWRMLSTGPCRGRTRTMP